MNYRTFPLQKIPLSKKNRDWWQSCTKYIVQYAEADTFGRNRVSKSDMYSHYRLYNSEYNEERLKYVTNPFKQDDGFPATAQDINIVKPQIDLLLGEESKRPFNISVIRTSDSVTSEVQDKMRDQLTNYMMSAIYANMTPEDAAIFQEQLQTGEVQTPESILEYYQKSYKDVAESVAYKTLQYLRHAQDIDEELLLGWKDALIASEEIYYVGERNGQPCVERVNPIFFFYEHTPDMKYIHEASWACRKIILSHQELYDNYYDKFDNDTLDKVLTRLQSGNLYDTSGYNVKTRYRELLSTDYYDHTAFVTLWHATWQSYHKVGFVTLQDQETGETYVEQVDETYYVTGQELDIKWEWATQTCEGYYIADDIFFGMQPCEYQYTSMDNINSTRIPYTGGAYSYTNARPKSFLAFLEPLQYIYIILWYRLELAMARDKGKVLTMDITQIPTTYEIDVDKWLHMLSALGINLINPYDEGWDIPGREGGKPASFNQISSEDLSMANTIGQYIDMLDKVERMAGDLTGITNQRKGAIENRELVNNVERSIVQSSLITEFMFRRHADIKKQVYTMLLNNAKYLWSSNNPGSIHYVLEDGERIFLNINDDFLYSDFDLFISDASEDLQNIQMLKNLYQPAMQNGASLSDVAEIMTLTNLTAIKNKLNDIEQRKQQREDEVLQQQQQAQMEQARINQEITQMEMEDKQKDRDVAIYKIDQDNQAKIQSAMISAYRFQEDIDQNNDGVPDPVQIGQLAIKQQEADAKVYAAEEANKLKKEEVAQRSRESKINEALEKDRLSLERMKEQIKLIIQKEKDKAAMERELLKSKTALKNKVSGEGKSKK